MRELTVIGDDGQPTRRRLTLSGWAALASMAVLVGGLILLGLSSWYDLEDLRAVEARLPGSGVLLWPTVAGLFVIGVLMLVVVILTIAMLNGSRVALRLACSLAAAFALSCGMLLLFRPDDTQVVREDPNTTLVVVINHNPATMPTWAKWSEAAAPPVFLGGAVLATVVLLLPSTRRDLYARRRGH